MNDSNLPEDDPEQEANDRRASRVVLLLIAIPILIALMYFLYWVYMAISIGMSGPMP